MGVVLLLLLERPYVTAQLGVPLLLLVLEGGSVVPVPLLPSSGRDAHISVSYHIS